MLANIYTPLEMLDTSWGIEMERKIYFSLAMVATATAIITSLVIAFLFYDIYGNDLENIASKLLSILPATIGVLVFILIGLF